MLWEEGYVQVKLVDPRPRGGQPMPVNNGLGERIRESRELIGMSQAELARRIGISRNAMNDIETGDKDPRASRITAIALALDVTTDFLLGLDIAYRRAKRDKRVVESLKE